VSGPARRAPRSIQPPAQAERGLALGLLETLTGISRHQALDRLIRGRAWIALIAFALIGIVTLQLLLLTLNAHIGRALVRAAQLQRENAAYSIEDSELAGGERIESQAARLGMTLVPEGALRFLRVDPRADIARAGAALSAPVHSSSAGSSETGTAASAPATSATTASAAEQTAASSAGATPPTEATAGASGQAGPTTGEASAPASTPATPSAAPSSPGPTAGSGAGGATEAAAPTAGAASAPGVAGGTQSNGAG